MMLLARLLFERPSPLVRGEKVPKADEGFVFPAGSLHVRLRRLRYGRLVNEQPLDGAIEDAGAGGRVLEERGDVLDVDDAALAAQQGHLLEQRRAACAPWQLRSSRNNGDSERRDKTAADPH